MASFTYKHKKTKQEATYAQPNPRLEKSDNWERVKREDGFKQDASKS